LAKELTPGLVHDFVASAVWQEVSKRIGYERDRSFNKALDDSDPREAGKYRALQMVLDLPQQFLDEMEKGKSLTNKIKRVIR